LTGDTSPLGGGDSVASDIDVDTDMDIAPPGRDDAIADCDGDSGRVAVDSALACVGDGGPPPASERDAAVRTHPLPLLTKPADRTRASMSPVTWENRRDGDAPPVTMGECVDDGDVTRTPAVMSVVTCSLCSWRAKLSFATVVSRDTLGSAVVDAACVMHVAREGDHHRHRHAW
jgi:hypothetical protein